MSCSISAELFRVWEHTVVLEWSGHLPAKILNFFKFNFIFLIDNRFSSHAMYPDDSFLSFYSSQLLPISLLPGDLLLFVSLSKEQSSKRQPETKEDTARLGESFQTEGRRGNPKREKSPKSRPKSQRNACRHCEESLKNSKPRATRYTQRAWCRPRQVLCSQPQPLWSRITWPRA